MSCPDVTPAVAEAAFGPPRAAVACDIWACSWLCSAAEGLRLLRRMALLPAAATPVLAGLMALVPARSTVVDEEEKSAAAVSGC